MAAVRGMEQEGRHAMTSLSGAGGGAPLEAATIKLFLPTGNAKGLRTAEISNWTGKALAAPRTDLEQLLARDECRQAGVYVLAEGAVGSSTPLAYIGEAEVIAKRIKQHKGEEFWSSVIVFVSKDENLTKAHVRFIESRLVAEAKTVGRFKIGQNNPGGAKLPESDCHDMEVFLSRIRQLLPVLGSNLLVPIAAGADKTSPSKTLHCRIKGAEARGQRTADGFVVFKGSTAVLELRPSAATRHPFVIPLREDRIADGTLVERDGLLLFTRDSEFSSPSAAASVVHGGGASGPREWKTSDGTTLRKLDESA
jgi:hypothetical protein